MEIEHSLYRPHNLLTRNYHEDEILRDPNEQKRGKNDRKVEALRL
jgi:hypothetical protein